MHLCTLCKENKQVELQILAPWRNQSNNSACLCVCVCVIINLLIKTQTRTHKHTHTHGHAQAGKQTQTITCNAHTHTCKRYCKMRSPGAALYSLPPHSPLLHLLFHSIFVLYPNSSNRRTLDGTPNKCLNIYFYINRNILWVFLFVIRFSLSYLLFTFFYACVFRSFVD